MEKNIKKFNKETLKNNLTKVASFQALIFSIFLAIVYADRWIIEELFKPYNLLHYTRLFHWVFFDVLSNVIYACLGLSYVITKGLRGWKVGAAIFLEGIILIRLGMEDLLYYVLFKEVVPSKLPWLNYNPVLVASTFAVSKAGLTLSVLTSILITVTIWLILIYRSKI
ncbi:MAG: hypothetical protein QW476_01030 [Candidatus Bathyarchaeia archaeon]|nr:hypothetical protein [Candidatus Bathyarchaeota archaeon]